MSERAPIRVYVETSVFGGVFDEEFREPSQALFRDAADGRFSLVTSRLVADELVLAPIVVRRFFEESLPELAVEEISPESVRLQERYLATGVVTTRWADDALHVAVATVTGCPLIVSWNFRHIVQLDRIARYNAVNTLEGYGPVRIHSPAEVIQYEEEL